MVGEFPELQGIMGGYYALRRRPRTVAFAIEDHYKPRFAGDALPRGRAGLAVALADKLETLAGLFGIGQVPTGDKDPFALRRHALGVIRMLIERGLPLDLPPGGRGLRQPSRSTPVRQAQAEVGFFPARAPGGYLREQGHARRRSTRWSRRAAGAWAEIPNAGRGAPLPRCPRRAAGRGQQARRQHPQEERRRAGRRRPNCCSSEPAEARPTQLGAKRGAAAEALSRLATTPRRCGCALKAPVDAFFDGVMVNADDAALRANRLALLLRRCTNGDEPRADLMRPAPS